MRPRFLFVPPTFSQSEVYRKAMSIAADNTQRLAQLEKQVIDLQLAAVRKDIEEIRTRLSVLEETTGDKKKQEDHENRIRELETSSTKVNTLIYLVTGGGLLGIVNLVLLVTGR